MSLLDFLIRKYIVPRFAGGIGERFTSRRLNELDSQRYTVLDNLLLPSQGNTPTTQIDHVIVSDFGIFCIETKNFTGWVFGNAQQPQWTRVNYHHKDHFYNPLYQNYAHIKALENLIRPLFSTVPIIGFVAFPSVEKLQVSNTNAVGHVTDVIRKIQTYNTVFLSAEDKEKVLKLLHDSNIQDKAARKSHINDTHMLKNMNAKSS